MKTMRVILIALFSLAAGLAFLSGVVYPQVKAWSYLVMGVCGLHLALSLIVTLVRMADAGRIAAWWWQGMSTLLCAGLLLAQAVRGEEGWLIAAAALQCFTILVTIVFALVLKPDTAMGA